MKLKVLLVDDQKKFRDEAIKTMEKTDVYNQLDIYQAENGQIAYDDFINKCDYDFLITDINMPEMDGITLIEKLHSEHKELFSKTDTFVMTTEGDDELIQRGRDVNIRSWLIKPVDWEHFTEILVRLAKKRLKKQ